MLVNSNKILKKARESGYAVGGFNTSDLEITEAIIWAAEKLRAPVIVQTSQKAIGYAGLESIVCIITTLAKKAKIPVILHADHIKEIESIQKCIEAGYTSVMIDVSSKPYEENLETTSRVVKLARQKGDISVEAELGAVGGKEDYEVTKKFLTDPQKAKEFVEKTGINSLAVAIGNRHGVPIPEEKLEFDLLEKIKNTVSIPLVLHGASSTPPDDIKKAISLGISKINIDTDIRLAFKNSIKDFISNHPDVYDPREILSASREAIQKIVEAKIKIFGSATKYESSEN